jgi:hypothetical protein
MPYEKTCGFFVFRFCNAKLREKDALRLSNCAIDTDKVFKPDPFTLYPAISGRVRGT